MKVYTTGCVDAVLAIAEDNLYVIGGVIIGLALPQVNNTHTGATHC